MIKRSNDECTNLVRIVGNMSETHTFFLMKKSEKIEKVRQITMKMDGSKISMLVREGTKGKKNMLKIIIILLNYSNKHHS